MWRIIKCDSACTICDKAQYNEASFRDKLCLAVHLVFCKSCRDYVRNNRKLTQHVQSKMKKLDPEIIAQMEHEIESELGENSDA